VGRGDAQAEHVVVDKREQRQLRGAGFERGDEMAVLDVRI
jgi:hypothetical protein